MLTYFEPTKIKPSGWLKRQLEIEAEGLCGNLDKIWPDVRDSAWIGGSCEGWERVPYWLDGFIPLAYLLDNKDMQIRADKYINAIIDRQLESGWICPCPESEIAKYDLWAVFLIGKVLSVYHQYTGSDKALNSLYSAMKNLYDILKNEKAKLFSWAKFRWFECFIPIAYLRKIKKEAWQIELAEMLKAQGADYDEFAERWKTPLNEWRLDTHIVNICMELKSEAMEKMLFGKSTISADDRYKLLKSTNGTAVETFTGDECLSGVKNNQGTELCSVNELLYSYEWLFIVTKNTKWLDRLEKIAFNALPATFTEDMWAHQYVQMVNQISASKFPGKSYFRTNGQEAHMFGLEPHYGCCTSNASQGYPKLTSSIFAKNEDAIICTMMLPARLNTTIAGNQVNVSIDTNYPFRLSGTYTVTVSNKTHFKLKIRIPSFSKSVLCNGEIVKGKKYIVIDKEWLGTESINIELFDEPHFVKRPYALNTVEWGSLVFALPIKGKKEILEYEKKGVTRKFPYCDYNIHTDGKWNYGFNSKNLELKLENGNDVPFSESEPSVAIYAELCEIDWGYEDGYTTVSNHIPKSRSKIKDKERIKLIPYGSTLLRMTEMPFAKMKNK